MTTEEWLAEMRATFEYETLDVKRLLELVDNILPSLVAKNIEIDTLQARVRELEAVQKYASELALANLSLAKNYIEQVIPLRDLADQFLNGDITHTEFCTKWEGMRESHD